MRDVHQLMVDLLECVVGEVEDQFGPVGRAQVAPGARPPDDLDCDAGHVWVRLVRMFRTGQFPSAAESQWDAGWAALLEVGHTTCVAVVDEHGTAPTGGEVTGDAATVAVLRRATLRAILCCEALSEGRIVNGWDPHGPLGGVAGGMWQVTVQLA